MKKLITRPIWWIAHNDSDIVHYGYAESGEVRTGQPQYEEFDNEQARNTRLIELGVDVPEEEEL